MDKTVTPPTITPLESYAALPGDTEYWPIVFAVSRVSIEDEIRDAIALYVDRWKCAPSVVYTLPANNTLPRSYFMPVPKVER